MSGFLEEKTIPLSDYTWKQYIVYHVYCTDWSLMFHGLYKGLFGCGLWYWAKVGPNPVSPFLLRKEDKVGFFGRVNDPHEWLHIKAVHCLLCKLQVLKPQNASWPLQGSFQLCYGAKVGPKPSFTIFTKERRQSRVFWKSKWSPWVT